MSPKCDVLIRCAKSASKFDVTVRESNHLRHPAPLGLESPRGVHLIHAAAITLVIFFLSNEKFDREGNLSPGGAAPLGVYISAGARASPPGVAGMNPRSTVASAFLPIFFL